MMEFIKNLFLSRWFFYITFVNKDGDEVEGWRIVRACSVASAITKVSNEVDKAGGTDLMFIRFNKL